MNKLVLITLIATLFVGVIAENYAVLVAGSNSYSNYRHQADVCHAYHTLLKKGYKANNIIVMSYNDVATASWNPFPGKLFNKPSYKKKGVDVNKGCVIDYESDDVTPQNYLAIIQGQKDQVKGGNGRVLESGPNDHVFLSFFDHGAPGLIAFTGGVLYATDLQQAFQNMFDNKKYARLVYYLEACESGSMFQNMPTNLNIYAVSAASPYESSWGTYCGNDAIVEGKNIGSCLGDLFSVNWMEDTDKHLFISHYSLEQQFVVVANLTNESQVMQWGDVSFTNEAIGDYMSRRTHSIFQQIVEFFKSLFKLDIVEDEEVVNKVPVNSREITYNFYLNRYKNEPTTQNYQELNNIIQLHEKFQKRFDKFSQDFAVSGESNGTTTNFDCYSHLIDQFQSICGKIPDDKLGQLKYFYQYCGSQSNYKSVSFSNYFTSIC